MDKVIIYEAGGQCCVLVPGPAYVDDLDALAKKDIPTDATKVKIVDRSELPSERDYRDAWKISSGKVSEDVKKARDIFRDRMREARTPRLQDLDIQAMRALEDGDTAKLDKVKAEKQKLRDLPAHPDIDNAKTVDDLRKLKIM